MPLSRRLSPALIPLGLMSLTLAAVAVAVFFAMSGQVARARQVGEELRGAYEVSQRLIQARAVLVLGGAGDLPKADARLAAAQPMLEAARLPAPVVAAVQADLQAARMTLSRGEAPINHALNGLASAVAQLRQEAAALDQSAAQLRLWGTIGVVAAVLATAATMWVAALEMQKQLEGKVRRQASELARAERLASVGFLAAGVAHEINNPLAVIATEAELAQRGKQVDSDTQAVLRIIQEEAFRCKAITARLLETARGGGTREPLDLRHEVESVVALAQKMQQARTCCLRVDCAPGASIKVLSQAGPLRQVLLNLVVNAMEAAPQGQVVVALSQRPGQAQVEIKDNGAGIAAEDLPRIFEPFFTTKKNPATPGLGLGLSIAHAIVLAQGGALEAQSAGVGQGATFILKLPLCEGV